LRIGKKKWNERRRERRDKEEGKGKKGKEKGPYSATPDFVSSIYPWSQYYCLPGTCWKTLYCSS